MGGGRVDDKVVPKEQKQRKKANDLSFCPLYHGFSLLLWIITRGRTYAKKMRFFTQKKSRLRKSENAVRLLYAKNSDRTHQNAFGLFVFCT